MLNWIQGLLNIMAPFHHPYIIRNFTVAPGGNYDAKIFSSRVLAVLTINPEETQRKERLDFSIPMEHWMPHCYLLWRVLVENYLSSEEGGFYSRTTSFQAGKGPKMVLGGRAQDLGLIRSTTNSIQLNKQMLRKLAKKKWSMLN